MEDVIRKTQGAASLAEFSSLLLSGLCQKTEASQALFYVPEKNLIRCVAAYAYHSEDYSSLTFELGDGLVGQVAQDGQIIQTNEVPEGFIILSGLGQASATGLLVYPFKNEENIVIAIVELASFKEFDDATLNLLNNLNTFVVNSIKQWN